MKTTIVILGLVISGFGLSLWYFHFDKSETESNGTVLSSAFTHKEKKNIDVKQNTRLVDQSIQQERSQPVDFTPETVRIENNVEFWEPRIAMFVQRHAASKIGDAKIHALALDTTNLFQMIREAANRQQRGLEPYTSVSEFKTMTTLVSIEQEFETLLGLSFSNFIMTLDEASIMSLFDQVDP